MTEIPTPTSESLTPTEKSRPTGVTILAILMILGGILNLISAPGSIYMYGVVYAGYSGITGIIGLILGIALYQMLPWSRNAAIIWEIIGLVMGFVMMLAIGSMLETMFGPGITMVLLISMIPSIIIALIVIFYLMQGSIKAAFEKPAETW